MWLRLNIKKKVVAGRPLLEGLAFDVTELVTAHNAMRHRAEHDDLTGLANKTVFLDEVTKRLSTQQSTAVLLLDLDRRNEAVAACISSISVATSQRSIGSP